MDFRLDCCVGLRLGVDFYPLAGFLVLLGVLVSLAKTKWKKLLNYEYMFNNRYSITTNFGNMARYYI